MDSKRVIIFGVTGQDGSYLADLLLDKEEYDVLGVKRRSSTNTEERIAHLKDNKNFHLVEGDIVDFNSVNEIIKEYNPHHIYNLAAQSHVGTSFKQPTYTFQVNTLGVLNILESIRNFDTDIRFYQASTSEMFGNNTVQNTRIIHQDEQCCPVHGNPNNENMVSYSIPYQDENTKFEPASPYAVSKLAAHNLVGNYRTAYKIHGCCGILFNHESERRGEHFVTRKITKWIGEFVKQKDAAYEVGIDTIRIDKEKKLIVWENDENKFIQPMLGLGNIASERDWGHAEDYVRAMYLMVNNDFAADYVISSGETRSVEQFLEDAFKVVNIQSKDWESYIYRDKRFYRPSDVTYLLGNPAKALQKLKWRPEIPFEELVERMVNNDIQRCCRHERTASLGHDGERVCGQGVCSKT